MSKTTTFGGIVRSYGGGDKRATTPAVATVVVPFLISDPTAANTTAVDVSTTNSNDVILPPNAIVTSIVVNAAATGGSNPTFDLGWVNVDDAADLDVDGLLAEADADAGVGTIVAGGSTGGNDLGVVFETASNVRITGGVGASAATGGSISGFIHYHVKDDGLQAS